MKLLCAELKVSRSGYYAWLQRQHRPGQRATEDARLRCKIRELHLQHEQVYGSPRLTRQLRAAGERCGRHRVARLMREEGLRGRPPRRFRVRTTDSRHCYPIAPNRLLDRVHPTGPNQVWVCDITYILTHRGWIYLAAVMDLYSRRIVGWSTGCTLETTLVLTALQRAIALRRPPPGLIVHSDRGIQYASTAHRQLLEQYGLIASMSRLANCYDNAAMESFWSTLKWERLFGQLWLDHPTVHLAIFQYIEGFYNTRRLHSSLGYLSPLDFESLSH